MEDPYSTQPHRHLRLPAQRSLDGLHLPAPRSGQPGSPRVWRPAPERRVDLWSSCVAHRGYAQVPSEVRTVVCEVQFGVVEHGCVGEQCQMGRAEPAITIKAAPAGLVDPADALDRVPPGHEKIDTNVEVFDVVPALEFQQITGDRAWSEGPPWRH